MKTCGCAGIKVEYMFGSVKCFNRQLWLKIYSAHTCIYVQSNKIYMCYVTCNVHTCTMYIVYRQNVACKCDTKCT